MEVVMFMYSPEESIRFDYMTEITGQTASA
ncbi:hypothetical protein ACSSVV_004293 [Marinobacter sp. MBR-105]